VSIYVGKHSVVEILDELQVSVSRTKLKDVVNCIKIEFVMLQVITCPVMYNISFYLL